MHWKMGAVGWKGGVLECLRIFQLVVGIILYRAGSLYWMVMRLCHVPCSTRCQLMVPPKTTLISLVN
eukprot:COSAG02_NODE_42540_length_383_cov_1.271127_1_plen_66_part_10